MAHRRDKRPDRTGKTAFQVYLLDRLAALEDRQRSLPPEFRDHPIGRLTAAAIEATLENCHWAGVAREAERIVRSAPATVPA
jgi:hypothetical protein